MDSRALSLFVAAVAAPSLAVAGTSAPATQTYVVGSPSAIDYAHAKPKPLPQASGPAALAPTGAVPSFPGAATVSPGKVGTGVTSPVRLAPATSLPSSDAASPQDFGTSNLPFSTYRVDGYGTQDDQVYPYRATGRLFFKEPSGTFVCSASLVKNGIVVTAAHCVALFGSNKFYTGWQYVPAYNNGDAPFGVWNARSATVLTSYLNGSDACAQSGVICKDDVAVLTLLPNSKGAFPGAATGHLGIGTNGYSYAKGTSALVAQIGYPVSLDGGELMQRNDAQGTVTPSLSNNTVIGSLMTGGSSGGPWVVNWGQAPANSGPFGLAPSRNIVVGVTSWGYTSPVVKEQGASGFTSSNITVLINRVCGDNPGNC